MIHEANQLADVLSLPDRIQPVEPIREMPVECRVPDDARQAYDHTTIDHFTAGFDRIFGRPVDPTHCDYCGRRLQSGLCPNCDPVAA